MELLTVESRLWSEIGEFDLKKGTVVNVKLDVFAGASLKGGGAGGQLPPSPPE